MSEEQYLFNAQKYPWYSPRYVLEAFDYLLSKYDGKAVNTEKAFEKAREMRATAICLLGMYHYLGDNFLMQAGYDRSPDVRTMVLKEIDGRPVHGFFQEVELVTLEPHSPETDIVKFLERTKLSKKYSYDEKTIVLCEVQKDMILPPYEILHQQLSQLNPRPTVMMVGRISPDKHLYSVCQLWPSLDLNVVVDVLEVANSYPAPHNLRFTRGMSHKIEISRGEAPKPTYYEVFGIRPENVSEMVK